MIALKVTNDSKRSNLRGALRASYGESVDLESPLMQAIMKLYLDMWDQAEKLYLAYEIDQTIVVGKVCV